eukprot:COSAG02_NODE_4599_length_5179_cov_13.153543_1_plen_56_part_10
MLNQLGMLIQKHTSLRLANNTCCILLQPGAYAFLLACEICTCTLVHGVMYEERSAR